MSTPVNPNIPPSLNPGLSNILSNIGVANFNIQPVGPYLTTDFAHLGNVNGGIKYSAPKITASTFQPTYGYGIGTPDSGLNSTLVNPSFGNVVQMVCSFDDYSQIQSGTQIYNPYVMILNDSGYLSIWSSGAGYPPNEIFIDNIANFSNVSSIAATKQAVYLVFNDGRVTGWGNNNYVTQSDPSLYDFLSRFSPQGVAKIALQSSVGLILYKDRRYDSFGSSFYGEGGGGDVLNGYYYEDHSTDYGIQDLYAGCDGFNSYFGSGLRDHCFSLALMADGSITGWGYNYITSGLASTQGVGYYTGNGGRYLYGFQGGFNVSDWPFYTGQLYKYMSPVPDYNLLFPSLPPVKKLAIGTSHVIALLTNGTITGWGNEIYGGEITGAVNSKISGVVDIFAGLGRTMAIYGPNRTLTGWGYLSTAGSTNPTGNYFTKFFGLTGVSTISMGKSSLVIAQNSIRVTGTTPTGNLIDPPKKTVTITNNGNQPVEKLIQLLPTDVPVSAAAQTSIPYFGQTAIGSATYVVSSGPLYVTGYYNNSYSTNNVSKITGYSYYSYISNGKIASTVATTNGYTGYFGICSGTSSGNGIIQTQLIPYSGQQGSYKSFYTTVLISGVSVSGTNIGNINLQGNTIFGVSGGNSLNSIYLSGFSYASGLSTIISGSVITGKNGSGVSGFLLTGSIPFTTLSSSANLSVNNTIVSKNNTAVTVGSDLVVFSGTSGAAQNIYTYALGGTLVNLLNPVNTYAGFKSITSFGTYGEFNHIPAYPVPLDTGLVYNTLHQTGWKDDIIVIRETQANGSILIYSGKFSLISGASSDYGSWFSQSVPLNRHRATTSSDIYSPLSERALIPRVATQTVYKGFNYDTIIFNDFLINGSSSKLDGIVTVTTGSGLNERTVYISNNWQVKLNDIVKVIFTGIEQINGFYSRDPLYVPPSNSGNFINAAVCPIKYNNRTGTFEYTFTYTLYGLLSSKSPTLNGLPMGLSGPSINPQIDYTNPNWRYASGVQGEQNYLQTAPNHLLFDLFALYAMSFPSIYSGKSGTSGTYPYNGQTLLPPAITGAWNGIIPSGVPFKISVYTTGQNADTSYLDQVNFSIYDANITKILNTNHNDAFLTGTASGRKLVSRFTNPFLNGKVTSDQINVSGDPTFLDYYHHNLSLQNIQDKKRTVVNEIVPLFYTN
jgi:hypothetical protein